MQLVLPYYWTYMNSFINSSQEDLMGNGVLMKILISWGKCTYPMESPDLLTNAHLGLSASHRLIGVSYYTVIYELCCLV